MVKTRASWNMESCAFFLFFFSFYLNFLQIFYVTLEKLDGADSVLEVYGSYSTKRWGLKRHPSCTSCLFTCKKRLTVYSCLLGVWQITWYSQRFLVSKNVGCFCLNLLRLCKCFALVVGYPPEGNITLTHENDAYTPWSKTCRKQEQSFLWPL